MGYGILGGNFDPGRIISLLIALVLALTVHEFAHAKRAELAGDPTPRLDGRVTLNPLAHLDIIGSLMILVAGLGWGRPVMVNPLNFRHPRRDSIMVSAWGPLANILMAAGFGLLLRFNVAGAYTQLVATITMLNLGLAFFNLLPIYPLDGSKVLAGLLPADSARRFEEFNARFGILVLILVLVTPIAGILIGTPMRLLFRLITGA